MRELPANTERHAEFVRLLNAGHRRLLGYLVSLLGNRHDAEDVFQRASVTMWRQFEKFDPRSHPEGALAGFLAWASTVAFYEVKNFQRSAARSRLYFSDELMRTLADERVEDLAQMDPRREALEVCLSNLDGSARQLVEAAYLEEGSLAALAERLGRAPQTLYNKLNLIRRALADCVTRRLAATGVWLVHLKKALAAPADRPPSSLRAPFHSPPPITASTEELFGRGSAAIAGR